MGFSSQKYRKERQERPWVIHPVWRGIGCALILLIPIMAWYAAVLFFQTNKTIPLSYTISKPITIPYSQVQEIDRILAIFNQYTVSHNLKKLNCTNAHIIPCCVPLLMCKFGR